MFPLWATVIMSLLILFWTIGALSFAVAICWLLLVRLGDAIKHPSKLLGTLIAIVIFGGFAVLFGMGAYEVSSDIIDGLIGRFNE